MGKMDREGRVHDWLTHLKQLEAESIHIIREQNLKIQSCFTQLVKIRLWSCIKSILSCETSFSFITSGWKFKDMIAFRDNMAKTLI